MTEPDPAPPRKNRLLRFAPVAVILAALGAMYAAGLQDIFNLDWLAAQRDTLRALIADHYALSLISFALIYVLAVATAFPAASMLTISGGFLFGWLVGGSVVVVSATCGASLLFLAARTSFGAGLRAIAGPRVNRLAEAFENNAFSTLIVLRLAPVFPFFAMNIAPALFRVPLSTYVPATLIGIAPGTFAFAYLGSGIDSVLASAADAGQSVQISDLVTPELTIAFGALALVAAIPPVIRKLYPRRRPKA
jgi:uncharacterized membrane protein YdjX (TVP38/TMEM64 family)